MIMKQIYAITVAQKKEECITDVRLQQDTTWHVRKRQLAIAYSSD